MPNWIGLTTIAGKRVVVQVALVGSVSETQLPDTTTGTLLQLPGGALIVTESVATVKRKAEIDA